MSGLIFSSPVTSATLCVADPLHDPLIDLPGEQTQRQADHAALVAEHALDRQMRLAGIGGPEHGGDAARAQLRKKGATSHYVVGESR